MEEHIGPTIPDELRSPVVIGVAGGIGAGKSTVANAFEELGCITVGFDAEAKAALDRPDIQAKLVEKLARPATLANVELLGDDGRVDRSALGGLIFSNSRARAIVEGIVHPVVWRTADEAREEASAAGAWGIVLDAALLFEAGLDGSCDVAVFVDAPRGARLERVRSKRGWDAAELERRESAQLSPDEKRLMCHAVVENRGDLEEVRRQVSALCAILRKRAI